MKHAKRILRTLDYLPRWAWYTLSFFLLPPFGPVVVYLVFHALGKAAQDEREEDDQPDWVRAASTYMDDEWPCTSVIKSDISSKIEEGRKSVIRN